MPRNPRKVAPISAQKRALRRPRDPIELIVLKNTVLCRCWVMSEECVDGNYGLRRIGPSGIFGFGPFIDWTFNSSIGFRVS